MIDSFESIDIRVGTQDDQEAIIEFSLALSEDPFTSREKWNKLVNEDNIYPLVAVYKENIVGKIQARIVNSIGWLESAQVSPDFRKKGIAHTLVDAALDWLIANGSEKIRTVVDSDNLSARRIMERHHFSPQFLAINPTCRVNDDDSSPQHTADLASVLDEEFYPQFLEQINLHFAGNIMIDGRYLPLDQELFASLIRQRRVYTDANQSIMLVLSYHDLPSEYHGMVISKHPEGYTLAGQALRAFTSREMASISVCHAPSTREAMLGLAHAGFGWSQPHSLIIYERGSWQQREHHF